MVLRIRLREPSGILASATLVVALLTAKARGEEPAQGGGQLAGTPLAAVRGWPGYAEAPAIDPRAAGPAFEPAARKALPARLAAGLAPALPKARLHAEEDLLAWTVAAGATWRNVVHAKFEGGPGESAEVWAAPDGALQAHVTANLDLAAAGPAELELLGRRLLKGLWGGEPSGKPARVHADQNQCFLDWHGPDGQNRKPEACIALHVNRNREAIGHQTYRQHGPATIRILCGSGFREWSMFYARLAADIGSLTQRQGIAAALLRFQDLIARRDRERSVRLPESPDALLIRKATAVRGGWEVDLASDADVANQAGGFAFSLTVGGPEGRVGSWGHRVLDARNPERFPLRLTVAEVRAWPEFAALREDIEAGARRARDAWAAARPEAARVLAAVRPDLREWAEKLEPFLDFCTGEAILAGVGQSSDPALIRFRFAVGAPPRLLMAMVQAKRMGQEPPDDDQAAWQRYAEESLATVFGKRPDGPPAVRSHKDIVRDRTPRPAEDRAGPPAPFYIFTWTPSWRGAVLLPSLSTTFTVYTSKERLDLRWERPTAPGRTATLLALLDAQPPPVDARAAAMAVARNADRVVDKLDPKSATIASVSLEVIDTTDWSWQQETQSALFVHRALTLPRLGPVILWTVRLKIERFTEVLGRVDPATGRVVLLTRLNTRPPAELKT